MTPENATSQAARSVKWSILSEAVSRAAQPLVIVVLAKLLTPEDYGVVGLAAIAISFCQMFWEAGLSKALIQTNESPERAANVVFWTNLGLGLVIYLTLVTSAPWVAAYFDSPKSGPVLRVLALQVLISSATTVQRALFARGFQFKRLFHVRLATAIAPASISIPMAWAGWGPWALVAGTLTGQTLNLFMMWRLSAWRPRWHYDLAIARRLLRFGAWATFEAFGAWLLISGDQLLVGKFLGVHDLGVFRTSVMLVSVVFGAVLNPVLVVAYPMFSRFQQDKTGFVAVFHRVNRLIVAVAVPMGLGLLLISSDLASALFGPKWEGLGFALGLLGLKEGVIWLVGLNAEAYQAVGRPDVNARLMFAQLLICLPAYYLAVQYGFHAFVCVRLLLAIVLIPIHVLLCVRMLGTSPVYLWQQGKSFFLAGAVMSVAVLSIRQIALQTQWLPTHIVTVLGCVLVGAATYGATLWALDRGFARQTVTLFREKVLA